MLKLIGQQLRHQTRQLLRVSQRRVSTATSLDRPVPVNDAISGWDKRFRASGVGDIDFNLKCIVAHVLQTKFNKLPAFDDLKFTKKQQEDFARLCEARCARMPLQYIVGEWDFMDITLKTAPSVFIPRPETEEFVHKVINVYRNVESVNILEIGCGSGAMSLAILHALPQVRSTAVERSKKATALAWENAKLLKLNDRFTVYNHTTAEGAYLPDALKNTTYDLIISNPPYVKSDEFQHLAPEIMVYENLNALDGGPDGLRIARLVFDAACVHLRPAGKLWMELGSEHPPLVMTMMDLKYAGRLRYISGYKDQYQRERFVEIEKI